MSVVHNDFVEAVLAASEPAERPLRRRLLDVLLAPPQPAFFQVTWEDGKRSLSRSKN